MSAIISESELLVLELKPVNHAVTFIHLYRKQRRLCIKGSFKSVSDAKLFLEAQDTNTELEMI